MLDEHGCTTCYTRGDEAHGQTRFESIWIKELVEAKVASRTVDVEIPIDPNVRSNEPVEPAAAVGGHTAAMGTRKLGQNTVVERDGGTSWQLDENLWKTMDVSVNPNATTTPTKQRTETQLMTNTVESCIGGVRNVAGQQAEQADVLLPIETMKYSTNTIADVSRQYEHCDGKLKDRIKHVAE